MIWSFSTSKMFSECPRKWYYFEIVASHTAKNPLRREAYLLKQLQSLYAWRGAIVDAVIEKLIVPRIKSKNLPSEGDIINYSMNLMERQLKFGKERRHRCRSATKSSVDESYCAFFDLEYNRGLDEEAIKGVKGDVIVSLRNLLHSNLIKEIAEKHSYIAAQRSLIFQFEDTTISCTPDLLVFSTGGPPLIVDWKVHTFANVNFWLQLGLYAIALSRIKPHKDFPEGIENQLKDPTTFRLIEYQLIKDEQREHSISSEDIADIVDYIFLSCRQMKNVLKGKKFEELDIEQFQTARFSETCCTCQFRKLCWRKNWYEPY